MTSEEMIERVIEIGYDVHFNDGVCWIKSAPFYCNPVIPFQVIEPGKAKPKMHKALLAYSHQVSDTKYANKYESILLLREEKLSNFGIQSLSSAKRAQVRKGLKLTNIRKIEEIESVLNDMKEIEISKATRIKEIKPPEYYIKHYDQWRAWTIKQFNIDKGKKEYWGAFYNETLIAFMKIYQINDTVIISYAASHSDHLDKCPNDALTFSIIDYCKGLDNCNNISYGLWEENRQSLNDFKQKYGFERVDLPVFVKYNFHILPLVKKILEIKRLRRINELFFSFLDRVRQ